MSRPTEHRSPASDLQLHVCGSCESPLVQPVDWDRMPADHWQVELRCPECEWRGTSVITSEEAAAFDEELERGADQLVTDLACMFEANMEDEVEAFAAALQADLILPEDF